MRGDFYKQLTNDLDTARAEGLFKEERIITSAQQADITVGDGSHVINFCANNYLGLANHPELINAAKAGMDSHGFGMASVRFICGTQDSHKVLEQKLASFLGMEDAILYSSCFDANGGLFETLLGAEDAIISDALNHASIIDGVRLCKAKRFRYANNDMVELEERLKEARAAGARHVLIATDGVFSMDGVIANLKGVCDLADKYDALVMVDDSHAVGFVGENGRGSHEYCDVMGRVDIITGTLGKALGGASGGYTAARKEVVEWLRQRSRPYLFSNSLAPAIVAASIKVLEMVGSGAELRDRLWANARLFREKMTAAGFTLAGADHAIIPVMLGDAVIAQNFARELQKEGIWMTDVPEPELGHNDLLIKIRKTAICGTDVHIYNWDEWSQKTIPVPMVVGHEYVGEVVGIGQEVRGFKIGDRVSGEGHITCGHCRNCRAGRTHLCRNTIGVGVNRPGCFAEYLVIPAFNAFKIPDNISDDLASIFDPFGNAVHTALSFDLVGEDVLVSGAGPIGVMAAAVAKHVGARNVVITDVNEYRLDLARKMGVTRAVNVSKENLNDVMAELGMTEGFDVGLEMSGAPPAFRSMLDTMNHGGRIAMLGIPPSDMSIDWTKVIFKGLFIKGIYGREMFETWYKMAALIQSGLDLSPMITHRFGIDDFQKGFDAMRSGQSGKVVLSWD